MWAAFALVVASGGTAFMVRFLIALLREGSPSV
jgi:SNF family Na+-dependent transporter